MVFGTVGLGEMSVMRRGYRADRSAVVRLGVLLAVVGLLMIGLIPEAVAVELRTDPSSPTEAGVEPIAGNAAGASTESATGPAAVAGLVEPAVQPVAQVMVTFRGDGACGSSPDVVAVLAAPTAWLDLVNQTGYRAGMQVGARRVAFPAGAGRSIRLRPGRYVLQLRPVCQPTGRAVPLVVDIRDDAPDPPLVSRTRPGVRVDPPTSAPLAGRTPAGASWPTTAPQVNGGGVGQAGGTRLDWSQADGDLTALRRHVPADQRDVERRLRRNRLIAIIALICASGVASGLIRAIMTQRITRAIPPN
jgi:hypothetical protein